MVNNLNLIKCTEGKAWNLIKKCTEGKAGNLINLQKVKQESDKCTEGKA
jgi:uncharacterized low-complexity protein